MKPKILQLGELTFCILRDIRVHSPGSFRPFLLLFLFFLQKVGTASEICKKNLLLPIGVESQPGFCRLAFPQTKDRKERNEMRGPLNAFTCSVLQNEGE